MEITYKLIILQIIAVLIQIYIANVESIKKVTIATFLYNIFCMCCYFINSDIVTVYMYIIITMRSFIYIYKDKLKNYTIIPIFFILLQLSIGLISIETVYQIISILTPCYVIYYMWFYDTTQKLRLGNIINHTLWGIYNFITGLYIISISRFISVIINCIALYTHKNKEI